MPRPFRTSILVVGAFVLASLNVVAQTNLTAKVTGPTTAPAAVVSESDRVRDGLVGPVRRVRTEVAKLINENGKVTEAKRAVLEVVAYDLSGNKIENQYFPLAGANLTGKEVYKYDDKGNISEMTLLNADGSLLSKETYKYEFDFAGNWNKMTTAVAVIEGGRMSFEPTEVTYRSIMYYLDDKILRMAQPAPAPADSVASADNKPVPPAVSQVNNTARVSAPALPTAVATNKGASMSAMEISRSAGDSQSANVKLDSEPPPPAPKPILRPVSGGVLNGNALTLPAPAYPDLAKRMRISGTVSVDVVVDETGKVIAAQASGGPVQLREVATQAALKARFTPTKISGQPVKVSGTINYRFSLSQ